MAFLGVGGVADVRCGDWRYSYGPRVHGIEAGGCETQGRESPNGLFCASCAHSGCWRPGVRQSNFEITE